MGRKVRKQINIELEHEAILREAAARYGVSESEIIRRALEAWSDEEFRERAEKARAEREELLELIRERHARQGLGETYRFNRMDAYEHRLSR